MLALENPISRQRIAEDSVTVTAIQFYVMGDKDIEDVSHVDIRKKESVQDGIPIRGGVYDPAMGVTNMNNISERCRTCENDAQVCPGHHGLIRVKYPVKSQIHIQTIVEWLRATCEHCGMLVVPPEKQVPTTLKSLSKQTGNKDAKKNVICHYCGGIHAKFSIDKSAPWIIRSSVEGGASEIYYNHHILRHLERISDHTVMRVMKTLVSHPRKFVTWNVIAAANTARQEIEQSGGHGRGSNDITFLLSILVDENMNLPDQIPADNLISNELRDRYTLFEMYMYSMQHGTSANSKTSGKILSRKSKKQYQAFPQRFAKKTGRVREDLMGHRVFMMARGTITGNPHIRIDEVGIPLRIAKDLFIPERVTEGNYERMSMYFMNGNEYPGCSHIVRAQNGRTYKSTTMKDYILEVGDVIHRMLLDGDIVDFGRQPSLTESSLSAVHVRIMHVGGTICMNPSMCNYFNADFDGDAMLVVVFSSLLSRVERQLVGNISNFFVSTENMKTMSGLFYDSLLSVSQMTRSDTPLISKETAMQICAQTTSSLKFTKKFYTGRELVEMFLPDINLTSTSGFYQEAYSPPIQYNPDDVKVVIRGGKYISGILDKKTMGQGTSNSVFHHIFLEYGPKRAMDAIYEIQQMVNRFTLYKGFSIGYDDYYITPQTRHEINERLSVQMEDVKRIVERKDRGDLFAPINQTIVEFLENELLTALETDSSIILPVLESTDVFQNSLFQAVMSGMKGKMFNVLSAMASIGQVHIRGGLPPQKFGPHRTLPWTWRFDMNPLSRGFIPQSYLEGIRPAQFYFAAKQARQGLENIQSKTAASGTLTRLCSRNLEVLSVQYNYTIGRPRKRITQFLFAGNGFNARQLQGISIPGIKESNAEFGSMISVPDSLVHKRYRNDPVRKIIKAHTDTLRSERVGMQNMMMEISMRNYSSVFATKWYFPVNPQKILEKSVIQSQSSMSNSVLDPVKALESVQSLLDRLGYIYFNRFYESARRKIPDYMLESLKSIRFLIMMDLRLRALLDSGVNNRVLDIVCTEVFARLKLSLLQPGSNVGVLSAQTVTAPVTQDSLDAKHRVGLSLGTRTSMSVRISEIISLSKTENMRNPRMILHLRDEDESLLAKAQDLANSIEMIHFSHFMQTANLFYEKFGKPVHPRFEHEAKWIGEFLKKHDQTVPGDLSKWCIRVALDAQRMILKSITVLDIVEAIIREVPGTFIVYTSEHSESLIIRVYFRNSALPKKVSEAGGISIMRGYLVEFMEIVVRGVSGVKIASAKKYPRPVLQEDGSVKTEKRYLIETQGTNLVETLLQFPELDTARCKSDSIEEMEHIFGIETARMSILNEICSTLSTVTPQNASLFADEMCILGIATSFQLLGLTARNPNNVFLQMALNDPLKSIKRASAKGVINDLESMSSALCSGTIPCYGTTCHEIVVDNEFVVKNRKTSEDLLTELEKAMK